MQLPEYGYHFYQVFRVRYLFILIKIPVIILIANALFSVYLWAFS